MANLDREQAYRPDESVILWPFIQALFTEKQKLDTGPVWRATQDFPIRLTPQHPGIIMNGNGPELTPAVDGESVILQYNQLVLVPGKHPYL